MTVRKSPLDMYVIEVVRKMRINLGMSQAQLAVHLNVSNGFIGQVESPKHPTKYSIEQINEIAKALNCSPKDFFPEAPYPSSSKQDRWAIQYGGNHREI